jgi:hypothetical protein
VIGSSGDRKTLYPEIQERLEHCDRLLKDFSYLTPQHVRVFLTEVKDGMRFLAKKLCEIERAAGGGACAPPIPKDPHEHLPGSDD